MDSSVTARHTSTEQARAAVRAVLSDATGRVALALPVRAAVAVREELADAVDRGAFVMTLLDEVEADVDAVGDLSEVGSVVRTLSRPRPSHAIVTADARRCLVGDGTLLVGTDGEAWGSASPFFTDVAFQALLGLHWTQGVDRYTPPPLTGRRSYDRFWHAVVDATASLRERVRLRTRITAVPTDGDPEPTTLRGTVVSSRQALVEPNTAAFPGEVSLVVRTTDDRVTVGGANAWREDYRARSVSLERAEGAD